MTVENKELVSWYDVKTRDDPYQEGVDPSNFFNLEDINGKYF